MAVWFMCIPVTVLMKMRVPRHGSSWRRVHEHTIHVSSWCPSAMLLSSPKALAAWMVPQLGFTHANAVGQAIQGGNNQKRKQ